METVWRDIRYSFRMMRKSPGFTAIVVLILAVAIGANTAIFSVVNAVMLRPLPYKDGHRLVCVYEHTEWGDFPPDHAVFAALGEQSQVFERMAGCWSDKLYVTGIDKARDIRVGTASFDFFPLLGVEPQLGRGFHLEEETPTLSHVALLSHAFWQSDLGGTEDAISKTVNLNGDSYTIIGVLPAGFEPPVGRPAALWIPLVVKPDLPLGGPVYTYAHLKKGVTLAQARAALDVIDDHLERLDPEAEHVLTVRRALDRRLEGKRKPLLLLLGAAGFVWLIACSNVANLFLARTVARQHEMVMRAALGASRRRLVQQLLTEGLLLSGVACLGGLLLAFWTTRGLLRLCPSDIPRLDETRVDAVVLAFSLGLSVLTALLFGAIPAWRTSSGRMAWALQEAGVRTTTGRRARWLHGGLVVTQIGLSLVTLTGAALLIRSLSALNRLDLGFQTKNVLAVTIILPERKYPEPQQCRAFFESLEQRVRKLPQVRSAGMSLSELGLGFAGYGGVGISIPGRASPSPESRDPAMLSMVTAGFLETLDVSLLRGRTFTEQEAAAGANGIVIDEYLARKHFGDTDPVGQQIDFPDSQHIVVGVVETVKDFNHLERTYGTIYTPVAKELWCPYMVLVLRADGDPLRLTDAIRAQVTALEREEVIRRVETIEGRLSGMLAPRRFVMILLGLFAGIALVLATVGIYGLLHFSATQQTRDIAIRMALGAGRADVRRMVLARGLRVVLSGVAIGLAGAVALTRVLSGLLYDVTPTDPVTLALGSCILVVIALLASYVPARRAARVDPMTALRCE